MSILWLGQIQPEQRSQVGSSLLELSQLVQLGHPVLPGFVIPATNFQFFLHQIEELNGAEPGFFTAMGDQFQAVTARANQIQQAIQTAPCSQDWLQDWSEATTQLSDRLDTEVVRLQPYLWCLSRPEQELPIAGLMQAQYCRTELEYFLGGIKRLWQEVFQAKQLWFWRHWEIQPEQIGLAILVQPIPKAVAAGFIQSRGSDWEVQSSWGLSLTISLGEIVPDRYWVDARGQVQRQSLGQKTYAYQWSPLPLPGGDCLYGYSLPLDQSQSYALTPDQLQDLLALLRSVQRDRREGAGKEIKLEWLWGDHFYFLQLEYQAAPLTPLSSASLEEPSELIPLLQGLSASSGQAIAPALVVTDALPQLAELKQLTELRERVILVVPSLQPDWLPLLKWAVGIICEIGGMTSHGAIMARELHLPAVVGVPGATQRIQSGDRLLIDGAQGQIYRLKCERPLALVSTVTPALVSSPPLSEIPLKTQLMVNLSQPGSLVYAPTLPVDGVGLLRSELMLLDLLQSHHPYLWLQEGRQDEFQQRLASQIYQFAAAFAPRPVYYRSLDLRSHECRLLVGGDRFEPMETNPMLGERGVSRYLSDPELFDLELAALAQVYRRGYTQVRLVLPFVRSVEEFCFCRQRAALMGLLEYPQFQLWIMAEVPSVLFLLPDYVEAGVQGISIGSNDLTQLLLGVDREQSHLNSYDERHPAVKIAIAQLVQTARTLGIPCSICGEAPVRYPELVPWLVNLGISSISVAPESVTQMQQAIAEAEGQLEVSVRLDR